MLREKRNQEERRTDGRREARLEWAAWKWKRRAKGGRRMRLLIAVLFFFMLLLLLAFVQRRAGAFREMEAKRETLLDLTADQITAIERVSDEGTVSYVREDGRWREAAGARVPESGDVFEEAEDEELQLKAGKLAASVTGVRLYQTLSDVSDLAVYGLKAPRAIIRVTDSSGKITEIAVGDDNDTTSTVYCYLNEDTKTVYAVSASLTAEL